jgi:hypothetical protein
LELTARKSQLVLELGIEMSEVLVKTAEKLTLCEKILLLASLSPKDWGTSNRI